VHRDRAQKETDLPSSTSEQRPPLHISPRIPGYCKTPAHQTEIKLQRIQTTNNVNKTVQARGSMAIKTGYAEGS